MTEYIIWYVCAAGVIILSALNIRAHVSYHFTPPDSEDWRAWKNNEFMSMVASCLALTFAFVWAGLLPFDVRGGEMMQSGWIVLSVSYVLWLIATIWLYRNRRCMSPI